MCCFNLNFASPGQPLMSGIDIGLGLKPNYTTEKRKNRGKWQSKAWLE